MFVVVTVLDHEKLAPKDIVAVAMPFSAEEPNSALMVKVSVSAMASEWASAQLPSTLQVTVLEFLKGVPLN